MHVTGQCAAKYGCTVAPDYFLRQMHAVIWGRLSCLFVFQGKACTGLTPVVVVLLHLAFCACCGQSISQAPLQRLPWEIGGPSLPALPTAAVCRCTPCVLQASGARHGYHFIPRQGLLLFLVVCHASCIIVHIPVDASCVVVCCWLSVMPQPNST